MSKFGARILLKLAAAIVVLLVPDIANAGTTSESAVHARMVEAYGKLPLSFEPNHDASNPEIRFLSRGSGYNLALTPTEAILKMRRNSPAAKSQGAVPEAMLRMKLVGAKSNARINGIEPLAGKSNYMVGKDKSKWRTNVPQFAGVRYSKIYDGIDLVYYGNQRQLEFDFEVAPGADPSKIQLGFEGIISLRIDPRGELALSIPGGELRQHKPCVYQIIAGVRKEISGGYSIQGPNRVAFNLGSYDKTAPLIIDPVMSYATYLGGPGADYGLAIAVDASGNAYVTGKTSPGGFPTTPGAYQPDYPGYDQIFMAKLNATGSALIYATYVGGASSASYVTGIDIDAAGNAYITGDTYASDFPTTDGAIQTSLKGTHDAFILKMNSNGSDLAYSTYIGGSSDYDYARGIAVDSDGNAAIIGYTSSTDFPVANAYQAINYGSVDIFVSKLNSAGTGLIFSTFLGRSSSDYGYSIATDSSDNFYITGHAGSGFPKTPGGISTTITDGAFVTKLDPAGMVVFSTLLGAQGYGMAIAIDPAGSSYVTGYTFGSDSATGNAYQKTLSGFQDAFVAKLNPQGNSLIYFTFLGGSKSETGQSIAIDKFGAVSVTGSTYSPDFPTANAIQPSFGSISGVYRSTDDGFSWTLANSGFPLENVRILAADPANSSVVYASIDTGIYKSSDAGASWVPTGSGPSDATSLVINPSNTAMVYAGTHAGVYQSTDGGTSWALRNSGLTTWVESLSLSLSNPGTLYAGTLGGVFKTTNGGSTWVGVNTGLPQLNKVVQSIAIHPADDNIVFIALQFGEIYKTTNGGTGWVADSYFSTQSNYVEDSSALAFDPTDSNTIYFSPPSSLYKTTDGGSHWSRLGRSYLSTLGTFVVSGTTPTSLYYADMIGLGKSTDGGITWNHLPTTGMLESIRPSVLAISASEPARLYAGFSVKPDGFIARLDPSGSFLQFSTFWGGGSTDIANGIAIDPAGNCYVAGYTTTSSIAATPGAFQPALNGVDAFVIKIARATRTPADFEADGINNIAVWRPGTGVWYSLSSAMPGSYSAMQWGMSGDQPIAGDYDADGKTDYAVWRPDSGIWFTLSSSVPGTYVGTQWGLSGDKPVSIDYDGDGETDIAVYRPSSGTWYILPSGSPGAYVSLQWGTMGDIPAPADYDGDGKTDIAVWRPGNGAWYVLSSASPGTYTGTQWGASSDIPVPGDYDGDSKTDIAVWRPGTGIWYALPSATPGSYTGIQWGASEDMPVSGDYDGDGKTDIAVWRPSSGVWYLLPSGSPGTYTSATWGLSSDIPISSLTTILRALPSFSEDAF
jgi:photosystem II stability/assembly factor-like uncharacterized protein